MLAATMTVGALAVAFLPAVPLLPCRFSGELRIAYARTVSKACVRFKADAKS